MPASEVPDFVTMHVVSADMIIFQLHPAAAPAVAHTFTGPWDKTRCGLRASSHSSPEHFPLIEWEGKMGKIFKGKMDKGKVKKALESASTLSEVYPFNAMGTSWDCDTAVCASCGKSWAKHLSSSSNLVQSIRYLLKPGDFT